MDGINQTPQTQQPLNQTPFPVNHSSKSKVIPIILGVVAVVAIAIGAYALGTKQSQPVVKNQQISASPTTIPTPTPDPTANWKTYTNVSGNFSIKYPSEWTYVAGGSINTGTETISFGQNVSGITEDTDSKMSIQMQKTSAGTGIVDAKSYKDAIIKGKASSVTTLSTTVDNVDGFKTTYIDGGKEVENIIFDKNNLIYSIMFVQHGKSSITIEDRNTFDQI